MPGQLGNVLAALAQGWQANFERIDPEIKVLTELVFRDRLPQIPVRRAQDAHVRAEWLGLTHAANFARFQEAEQLHLDVLAEFTDLVQEQRAAVGYLKQTFVIAIGTGERSLAMAKELALDQV